MVMLLRKLGNSWFYWSSQLKSPKLLFLSKTISNGNPEEFQQSNIIIKCTHNNNFDPDHHASQSDLPIFIVSQKDPLETTNESTPWNWLPGRSLGHPPRA
jgi:hypothetical protein